MPRTPIAHTLGELEKLVQSITPEDTAGRPQLKHSYGKLQRCIERIHQLIIERDFHEARKQEATREIQELLEDGRREGTVLRGNLKYELGHRNEELARFGVKPFRGRKRRKKAEETPSEDNSRPPEDSSS